MTKNKNLFYNNNLNACVNECAKSVFGVKSLYPWQSLVIANILDAVSAANKYNEEIIQNSRKEKISELYDEDGIFRGRQIVILPTGTGKSLCFQIPALFLNSATLIVYPLLALMNDQYRSMTDKGLSPAIFIGGQNQNERAAQFARLNGSDGKPPAKLIIVNPEILLSTKILTQIKKRSISHIAIDEAHCVTEWGESFRPSYLNLSNIIKELKPKAITAFTATASSISIMKISKILFNGKAHIVRGGTERPNISYIVKKCCVKEPFLLEEVLKRKKPLVVFCGTREKTEHTARVLRYFLHNKEVRFYHAGLQRSEKKEIEKWFFPHKSGILVTTCAWGLGVNKPDVRTVIHLDPPPSVEAYVQEAGRSGRDGLPSEAILLWSQDDKNRIKLLPEHSRMRAKILTEFAESGKCKRQVLIDALCGEKNETNCGYCIGLDCKVCMKSAKEVSQDEKFLLKYIKLKELCFTQEELIEELKHRNSFWRAGNIRKLINALKINKKIYESKNIFMKNKLKTM